MWSVINQAWKDKHSHTFGIGNVDCLEVQSRMTIARFRRGMANVGQNKHIFI
jgi:hypothetical protein